MQLPERYELVRRIATGGMASVWCAEDQLLGRRVAVKLLSDPYADDPTATRRFQREARVAARLSGHRHVVTIYDVGRTPDGRPFIVMEYLPGGTVADALRVGEVGRDEAIRWIEEAAAALDYAHGRGVIHRDIKPGNLLLDCDRVLHVADFGIARIGTDETITRSDQVFGTAGYLAPERVVGRPATTASDRYSLAVAAFELLVGSRPFTAEPFPAQARQHLQEEPPRASSRNPELPRSVDSVLARGMAKAPEDRWPSACEFAEALSRALRERAAAAAEPRTAVLGALRRPTRAAAGSRSAAPAGAALAAAEPARAARPPAPAGAVAVAERYRRPRAVALAALAAGAVAVAAILLGQGSSGRPQSASHSQRLAAQPAHHTAAPAPSKPSKTKAKAPAPAAVQHPSTTSAAPPTGASATSSGSSADALEARGHSLMLSGNYSQAIPVLRQALASASPGSLTYAYALFDLGHSLRLAGDPRQAVQVLWQRMQIPNQTGVVRTELQLALEALGRQANGSGGAGPGPAKDGGHGDHGHHGGPPGPSADAGGGGGQRQGD